MYGWGWYPCVWQGWFVILVFVGAMSFISAVYSKLFKFVANDTRGVIHLTLVFLAVEFVLAGILIAICYKTGESPRWEWGSRKDQD